MLNTVKVPCDPAQVIVNHASFRVRLGGGASVPGAADDTTPIPVIPTSVRSAAEARVPGRRRAAPVVWSGRTDPGDAAATQLLQAVRTAGGTQLLPRVDERVFDEELEDDGMPPVRPAVVTPRAPVTGAPVPGGVVGGARPSRGAFDGHPYPGVDYPGDDYPDTEYPSYDADPPHGPAPLHGSYGPYGAHDDHEERGGLHDLLGDRYDRDDGFEHDARHDWGEPDEEYARERDGRERDDRRRGAEPVRHAWYPGRRMNLGVVLLPLRVFLGFISIYAGMGKLCDPVYFDGGHRGTMVHWLSSLHPWSMAEPLRTAALTHPVGAGLTVAFLQVIIGVLTIMGLWQRVAAAIGALLSVALLLTVSWRNVPVYDAPHIIYLAAWSPLAIAGAPVYSVDAKLAGEAWRRLGPRAPLWDLRRYVLRRGIVLAGLVAGGVLVVGALFGSAVRASQPRPQSPPAPSPYPTNDLPGSPLPELPGAGGVARPTPHSPPHPTPSAGDTAVDAPSPDVPSTPSAVRETGGLGGYRHPSQQQTVEAPPQSVPAPRPTAPANNTTPSGAGSTSGGSLGGLLGSKSPTGWLLGMPGGRAAGSGKVA